MPHIDARTRWEGEEEQLGIVCADKLLLIVVIASIIMCTVGASDVDVVVVICGCSFAGLVHSVEQCRGREQEVKSEEDATKF